MDDGEELRLVEKAIKGDVPAFESLYTKYIKSIIYGARSWLYDKEAVDDAAQEIVLVMYKAIGKLKNPQAFKAWMQRIIMTVCVDANRKRKRETSAEPIEDFEEILADERTDGRPEAAVDRKNADEDLRAAIGALPEMQRHTLILYYYEEMDYKEIAQALGVTKATVSTNLIKARGNLKKKLEQKGIMAANMMDITDEGRRGGLAVMITSAIGADAEQVFAQSSVDQILAGAGAKVKAYSAVHAAGSAHAFGAGSAKWIAIAVGAAVALTAAVAGPRVDFANIPVTAANPPAVSPALPAYAPEAEIIFLGEEDTNEHVNPSAAAIRSESGADRAVGWRIEDAGANIVARGEGAEAGDAFAALSPGTYSIRWTLENADGQTAEVIRKFEIA
jgi:RNA polymerase sigma-70 factor (ECF subfamily)